MVDRVDLTPTLVEVAHLYYEEGLSQQEIADRLHVSRSLIALYIKKAREQGIVKIEIVDPKNNMDGLAHTIKEHFHLRFVHVVPSSHNSSELTRRALGNAAAQFLDQHLRDGDVLGLGWGRTINDMVSLLAPARPRHIDVVPLLGESGFTGSYTQLNQMVLQCARCFNATPWFLLAPILVGSSELRDALLLDESVNQTVKRWDQLTCVALGIGSYPPSDGQVIYIGEESITPLVEQGAVGDVCARYFDRDGNFLSAGFDDRMLAVRLDQLRQADTVLAVAGGTEKVIATLGTLRSGLVTTLFVDEALAQALLKLL